MVVAGSGKVDNKQTKAHPTAAEKQWIEWARARRDETKLRIEFLDLPGQRIPLDDDTSDTVVSTFTLCTITIRGLARILKPDGSFSFFELGLSPEASVQRWQRRLEPLDHWLFQGLHLTGDIPSLIMNGGFQSEQIEAGYLTAFPKPSYCWCETAKRK